MQSLVTSRIMTFFGSFLQGIHLDLHLPVFLGGMYILNVDPICSLFWTLVHITNATLWGFRLAMVLWLGPQRPTPGLLTENMFVCFFFRSRFGGTRLSHTKSL